MVTFKLIILQIVFILVVFVFSLKGNELAVQLSKEELECIKQTKVDIELIKRDKNLNEKLKSPVDSKFNEYLKCYIEKLRKLSKLQDTMSQYISVPGYRTKYKIPTIRCNENGEHVSGLPIPCILN
ncbi:hypothetical protein RN001_001291 [Aquatica leii]|uniref:Uncharacterized protein n=1 Tax=Aquatica leii TaxID=1421715 RepID=A0AAN7QAA1_9COLE|nr:hypothetical protein RN001_001291 [Aquatica leii]